MKVSDLELSVRTQNILQREGITNIDAFLRLRKPEVMRWKHAGIKVWREIFETQVWLRSGHHKVLFGELVKMAALWNATLERLNELPEANRYAFTIDKAGRLRCWTASEKHHEQN